MIWKELKGFRYPYRVSEEGEVQVNKKGEWQTLNVHLNRLKNTAVPYVSICVFPKGSRKYSITALMEDVWLPVRKKCQRYIHKNGSGLDCSVYNIQVGTLADLNRKNKDQRRRVVEKIDRFGNVLEVYGSMKEAAQKNHFDKKSIEYRCKGKMKNEFKNYDFSFRYERG